MKLYDNDHLYKVAQIIRHPKFNMSLSAAGGADIALPRLEASVTFSEHVSPITLAPASVQLIPGMKCWVTGWGTFGVHSKIRELEGGKGHTWGEWGPQGWQP